MANLLPPHARKKLIREYWVRVATICICMVSFVLGALLVMLIPTYLYVLSAVDAMEDQAQDAQAEQFRTELARDDIQKTNRLVGLLRTTFDSVPVSYYYDTLEEIAGVRVKIENFDVVRQPDGTIENIRLRATAQTRQALIDFLDTLNAHGEFGRVDIPIANLAQSENIDFTVTIPIIEETTN